MEPSPHIGDATRQIHPDLARRQQQRPSRAANTLRSNLASAPLPTRTRVLRPGDKWYLDEVFICIRGELPISGGRSIRMDTCSISSCKSRRNAKVATRFFRKLLTGLQYVPRVIVTDKL